MYFCFCKCPSIFIQNSGELEAAHKFPPAMANELLGMGTWRLKGDVNPCIEFLVQRLEGAWRELCEDGVCMLRACYICMLCACCVHAMSMTICLEESKHAHTRTRNKGNKGHGGSGPCACVS